jgi:hypothetical protein
MTNAQTPITDADLVTVLFGEAQESQRARTDRALMADAELDQSWRMLQAGLAAIDVDAQTAEAAPGFNERLREAYEIDLGSERPHGFTTAAARGRRWMRWSLPLAAAAAAALLLTVWLPTPGPNRAGVAWAEVTEAMEVTPRFRMTVFGSDPGSMFEDLRLFNLDMYYREPDGWRTHGWGQVCFHTGGELSLYDGETGEPIENTRTTLASMTRDVAEAKTGVLDAILNELFNDAPRPGEPVQSDTVVTQAGIDVFDFVGDPTQRRARVWVLRDSKLPLRIHIYTVGTEDFMLVSFDYSDPRPDDFFDHGFYYRGESTPR